MKKCLLLFHRGFTDQIAMMPIVDYYRTIYSDITILNVPQAKFLYNFYLKNKTGINTIYSDVYNTNDVHSSNINKYNSTEYDYLFHGKHDRNRLDRYKNSYTSVPWQIPNSPHFGKRYYEFYGIDFINKINFFIFDREPNIENEKYEEFIKKNSQEYILYHDDLATDHENINIRLINNKIKSINLNGLASQCFYYIKILENAKEIHLIDSVWAQFCYLLDAKYGVLKNTKIFLYPFTQKERWGGLIKDTYYKSEFKFEPVSLNNWSIII
jgi:hypothetical protein